MIDAPTSTLINNQAMALKYPLITSLLSGKLDLPPNGFLLSGYLKSQVY